MRCCCFAWATSTSCSTTTPRPPLASSGLTLTSRDKGENPIPMAGFPHHQLDGYLGKLIAAGFRAAVCEQVEDPKQAKGLVKREVTRVVTPGTLTDDALLDPRESNYLAAVAAGAERRRRRTRWASPGPSCRPAGSWPPRFPAQQLADELTRIGPGECLVAEDAPPLPDHLAAAVHDHAPARLGVLATTRPPATLTKHFGTASLEGFGFTDDDDRGHPRRRRRSWTTCRKRSEASLDHIDRLVPYRAGRYLEIDEGDAAQPGNHPHDARRPARRLAAGRDRPHRRPPWARGCWPTGSPLR